MDFLEPLIPYELYKIIYSFIRQAPQIIIGVAIVALGLKLIKGKKMESEMDD